MRHKAGFQGAANISANFSHERTLNRLPKLGYALRMRWLAKAVHSVAYYRLKFALMGSKSPEASP